MKYDLIVKNGLIRTIDQDMSTANWMGIKDGVITAMGTENAPEDAAEIIDLQGKQSVIPGLIDSHVHAIMTGIGLMGIDLAGIDTVQEILQAVETRCNSDQETLSVLCCINMNLPADMKDGRVPTKDELDKITGSLPVVLSFWTAHGGVLNSAALAKANLTPEMMYIMGDGYFNEDKIAFYIMDQIYDLYTDEEYKKIYENLSRIALSKGMTTLHALDGMVQKNYRDTEILMQIKDSLPVEFVPYTQTFDYQTVHDRFALPRVGGCLCVDGSPPQFTAAYVDPYVCNPITRGFLNYTDKELYDMVTGATKLDMQTAFHAIGDRAVDQITHVYQQVDRELGIRSLRHRVEHFSLPDDKHIQMARELGIVVAAQPAIGNNLDRGEQNGFELFVSKEKAQLHENFARLIKNGVMVMGSSDSPCSPFDAFIGLDCCVNPHNPARAVSLDTALRMYTYNGAYGAHMEEVKGSLEVGKQADFLILKDDIYNHADHITVDLLDKTFVKGQCMWSR